MTSHFAPGADMLPGLRASVDDARVRAAASRSRKAAEVAPAERDPIARVLVDLPLAHLDRPFDYVIPEGMSESAQPGCRVKVRFAGKDVDGYLVERATETDHTGRLQPLRKVVSPEPVLAPEIVDLSARVARRYAGTRSDVLRLAIPPRHATTEKESERQGAGEKGAGQPASASADSWRDVPVASSFFAHVASGGAPRAVWSAAPSDDWPHMIAEAVAVARQVDQGVLVCVPDQRDLLRMSAALVDILGPRQHAVLTAEDGPAARYRNFLAVSRGQQLVAVGTRSAAFAPVHRLGLMIMWDDGDDSYAEPRAPYPHTREVLLERAEAQSCGLLIGSFARSPQAQQLIQSGWAHPMETAKDVIRSRLRVDVVPGEDRGVAKRLPTRAMEAIKSGLQVGPVLVQTPRAGYATALACVRCRTPARCTTCAGPLLLPGPTQPPQCRWCGASDAAWRCQECGDQGLRAPVIGQERTAEELGRAFPGHLVRSSSGERAIDRVKDHPDIVVSTAGVEPVAAAGYAAVIILDTGLSLARDDLRVAEEALRRWMGAAALIRPGGRVVAVGDPGNAALQALVRWDPGGFAAREIEERALAHLPPSARIATIRGDLGAVDDVLTVLGSPPGIEILGPVPVADLPPVLRHDRVRSGAEEEVQVVLRVPRVMGAGLSEALGEAQRIRSVRKLDPVRIQIDPLTL